MSRTVTGAVVAVTLALAACSNNSQVAPTPEIPTVTETFAGTLTINGAITHPFVVGTPAAVTATLQSVTPDNTVPIGMSLGTWSLQTESCQAIISNDLATEGRILVGTAQTSGAFCVRAYDVGQLTQPTSYEIVVTHK